MAFGPTVMVLSGRGALPVSQLRKNDYVYDPFGKTIRVMALTKTQGPSEAVALTFKTRPIIVCSLDQQMVANKKQILQTEPAAKLTKRFCLLQQPCATYAGGSVEPVAPYALGAFLGNGCKGSGLRLAGPYEVPDKVAKELGATVSKRTTEFHSYLRTPQRLPSYYNEWVKGKYSHQKIADIEILRTWSRAALVQFIAGLFDTDGGVTLQGNRLHFCFHMQGKSVVEAFAWALLTLYQVEVNLKSDNRAYVNGPVWYVRAHCPAMIKRMLAEMGPYIVSPQKKWHTEWDALVRVKTPNGFGYTARPHEPTEMYTLRVEDAEGLFLLANGLIAQAKGGRVRT